VEQLQMLRELTPGQVVAMAAVGVTLLKAQILGTVAVAAAQVDIREAAVAVVLAVPVQKV
jgi:hypothetical protein